MTTLKIKTVTGIEFEVEGNNYKHVNGIHYLNGSSYPDSIVEDVQGGSNES